jgi:hypothetical protein
MKLGVYIMASEPISTAYFINPSHQSVCLYVYPPIVARQRLGRHVPVAVNTLNNRRIVGGVVFYAARVVSKESLWVCLCIPLSCWKGLQVFMLYSTHLNEQKCPSQHMSRNQCLLSMGDVWVVSTADSLCGSHAFQHNFQLFVTQRYALCRKSLVPLESPDRLSLLVAVIPLSHWSALNIPKSVGVLTAKHPEDLGQGIMQASWMGLRILSIVHQKSGSGAVGQCWENEVVPHHAWTTRVVVDEGAHAPGVLINQSQKNYGTLHLLVC